MRIVQWRCEGGWFCSCYNGVVLLTTVLLLDNCLDGSLESALWVAASQTPDDRIPTCP